MHSLLGFSFLLLFFVRLPVGVNTGIYTLFA